MKSSFNLQSDNKQHIPKTQLVSGGYRGFLVKGAKKYRKKIPVYIQEADTLNIF